MRLLRLADNEFKLLCKVNNMLRQEVIDAVLARYGYAYSICENPDGLREDLGILVVWSGPKAKGVLEKAGLGSIANKVSPFIVEVLFQKVASIEDYWEELLSEMRATYTMNFDVILATNDMESSEFLYGNGFGDVFIGSESSIHCKNMSRNASASSYGTPKSGGTGKTSLSFERFYQGSFMHSCPEELARYIYKECNLETAATMENRNTATGTCQNAMSVYNTLMGIKGYVDMEAFCTYIVEPLIRGTFTRSDVGTYAQFAKKSEGGGSPTDMGWPQEFADEVHKIAQEQSAFGAAARLCEMYCSQEFNTYGDEVCGYVGFLSRHNPQADIPSKVTANMVREYKAFLGSNDRGDCTAVLEAWSTLEHLGLSKAHISLYIQAVAVTVKEVLISINNDGHSYAESIKDIAQNQSDMM